MDPYLTARSFSTPCTLLALAGALDLTGNSTTRRRGLCLCGFGIALAAAMHPLMAAYALWATLALVLMRSSRLRKRPWATASLAAVTLATVACLHFIAKPESAAYTRIALTRTYWFPTMWAWYELLGLAAPLAILLAFAWTTSRRTAPPSSTQTRTQLAQMAVALGALALLVAVCFARASAATHIIARIQPLRAFQIVYLIMTLFLGAKLGESVLRRSPWRWVAALCLLGGIMFAVQRATFPNSSPAELPWITPRNPWTQAFLWVRDNTPKDALFALDADYINAPAEDSQSFRAIAERSALPDYSKDGGEASIAPELTEAWTIGQSAQRGLSAPNETDAQRIAALRPLGVSWIVLESPAGTALVCPYRNAAAKVCRLP
jgi:type IV secretory pathway VirB2 component (pilin)